VDDDDISARRAACTDSLLGNGLIRPPELLASIDTDATPDLYGEGGVVGVADLHGRSGEFRDALRAHGWPEVGPPA